MLFRNYQPTQHCGCSPSYTYHYHHFGTSSEYAQYVVAPA